MVALPPAEKSAADDTTGVRPRLLDIRGLSVAFARGCDLVPCVSNVGFTLARGEIVALVGESGSGKTMVARSISGLLPPGAQRVEGEIHFDGVTLTKLAERDLRLVRGKRIGMIFQEPMVALNPALRVRQQMQEAMRLHQPDDGPFERHMIDMLERLRVSEPRRRLDQYPHELSGGLRQRIIIASVLLPKPTLILADEPTTALDAINQREVMELLLAGARDLGSAVLLITHDLGVVADYGDRVLVMHQGSLVEQGDVDSVISRPQHPFTIKLLESLPVERTAMVPHSASISHWLEVKDLSVDYTGPRPWPWSRPSRIRAVNNVSLSVRKGECVALVGESGSGKTTLGRAILGLTPISSGSVSLGNTRLSALSRRQWRPHRRSLQFVFQDPYSSLNPRFRVSRIVAEGLRNSNLPGIEVTARVREVLDEVGLGSEYESRFPHQLSGGQRQRVGIARALVQRPELVIADEPVASLDLTVQAQILKLLRELQANHGFTLFVITHNLPLVSQIADRVVVMHRGHVVEFGPIDALFKEAAHPYSQALIDAAPYLSFDVKCGTYRLVRHCPSPRLSQQSESFFDPLLSTLPIYRQVGPEHFVAGGSRQAGTPPAGHAG